jgi:tellurite resistance protein TerC
VLVFIGIKMLLIDVVKIPVGWSLGFTTLILAATMALSARLPARASKGAYPFTARRRRAEADGTVSRHQLPPP